MLRLFNLCALLLLISPFAMAEQQSYHVNLPASSNGEQGKNLYVEKLLQHIFSEQGYSLTIHYAKIPSNKIRTAKLLSQNKEIDLFWANYRTNTSPQLTLIKYPLYSGYIGYRLLLINKKKHNQFSQIKSLAQLALFTGVQKKDWLDYNILVKNGLNIEGNLTFPSMFKAIEQELADYFPRSILEIDRELAQFGSPLLSVAPNIMLQYPSASYFYVNKKNLKLTAILQQGFKKIIKNGIFKKNFDEFFGESIKRHKLNEKQIIKLTNPYLLPLD